MTREDKRIRRKMHIRKFVNGTVERPRVAVNKSNRYIFAQLINDEAGKCIAGITEIKFEKKKGEKPTERAARMGKDFAKIIKDKKFDKIVFDRGGFKYHGRIKAFADAMREAGINF